MAEMPKEAVTLYLETWQIRMIKDWLRVDKSAREIAKELLRMRSIVIDIRKPGGHLNSYKVPNRDFGDLGIELYFTEVQKLHMQDALGLKVVDSMRLNADALKSKSIIFQ